ncbi:MAG: NADH-quinone oxidoreductase subunit A [Bdellovibrionia bacterium]
MSYIPVLILMLAGLTVGSAILLLSSLLGGSVPNKRKGMPFECGVPAYGSARHRFSVKFYLVAILFLLFDVEGIFFFPWAVAFKKYLAINSFILFEMGFFALILVVGYVYVLRKGALKWE